MKEFNWFDHIKWSATFRYNPWYVFVCYTACLSAFQKLFAARLNLSILAFQKSSEDLHLNCL